MTWGIERATRAAEAALRHAGCGSQPTLIRFGGSAVFRSDELVARVAPAELIPGAAAEAAIEVARWLTRRGVPVAEPAGTSADTQVIDGVTVSLWRWEQGAGATVPATTHGSLLLDLHRALDGYDGRLPRATCLGALEERLRIAAAHPRLVEHRGSLRRTFESLADRLGSVEPALPPGPIHCDPHGGNFLDTGRGWIVLDLDGVARGHREWDWASGVRSHAGADRLRFVESYCAGDIERWPGYEALVRLKRLDTLAWTAIHDQATGAGGTAVSLALAAL